MQFHVSHNNRIYLSFFKDRKNHVYDHFAINKTHIHHLEQFVLIFTDLFSKLKEIFEKNIIFLWSNPLPMTVFSEIKFDHDLGGTLTLRYHWLCI